MCLVVLQLIYLIDPLGRRLGVNALLGNARERAAKPQQCFPSLPKRAGILSRQ
jgi:hypothetical protein